MIYNQEKDDLIKEMIISKCRKLYGLRKIQDSKSSGHYLEAVESNRNFDSLRYDILREIYKLLDELE